MRRLLLLPLLLAILPAPARAAGPVEEVGVWQSGGLGEDTLQTIDLVSRIHQAPYTVIDAGTLRMLSVTRDALDVQRPRPGYGYPMSVVVYDLSSYSAHLDPAIVSALSDGGLIMSERSAALRGARVGDLVELEGWNERVSTIPITLIAPDPDIEFAEIVLARPTAERLGLDRPSSVRMWSERAAETTALLDSMLSPSARTFSPGVALAGMDQPLPTVAVKERFGEFSFRLTGGDGIDVDDTWEEANIVTVIVPRLGLFECHRRVVPYIRSVLAQIEAEGLSDLLDPSDFQQAGGCFNARLMRGGDKGFALSRHAWGVAFDVNPSTNRYGEDVTLDPRIGQIFRDWGFAWGAGWTVPDGMHFEWVSLPGAAAVPACAGQVLVAPEGSYGGWGVYSREGDCG